MQILIRFGIVFLLLFAGAFIATPAVSSQTSPHSVEIDVSPQQVFPGGSVIVTVTMSTVLDDTREVLDVSLPEGMEVVGPLTCTGACESAGLIAPGANEVTATFDVGSYEPNPQRVATLTFTAVAPMNAVPGSSLQISAYLGSPEVSDSVAVTVQEAPESQLYLDISPQGAVVDPGGSFAVFAYPYVPYTPGLPQEPIQNLPSLDVTVTLPEGLALDPGSECVDPQDPFAHSPTPLCSMSTSSGESGTTVVSIGLPSTEDSIGILLRLNNMGLRSQEMSSITFALEEPSGTLGITNPFTSMDVFAVESLAAMGADTNQGSMNVLVVSEENGCTARSSKLALAEWGGGPIVSTAETKAAGDLDLLDRDALRRRDPCQALGILTVVPEVRPVDEQVSQPAGVREH